MKKLLIALFIAVVAVSSFAQVTNQVLSRNAVGYVKVDLTADELAFIRTDFEPLSGDGAITDFIGDQVPVSTKVYVWETGSQTWSVYSKSAKGWGALTNVVFERGSSIFVNSPTDTNIFIMGEVPDQSSDDTFVYPGITALGIAYPVAVEWGDTALSTNLAIGDQFITWDGASYQVYAKSAKGWGAAATQVVEPGQGFFVLKASSTTNTWTQVKPYTWP